MTEEEKQLQDQDSWEFSQSVVVPGIKPRAVVSVAFSREDYQWVVQAAKSDGMKTSEFIRNAALSKAKGVTFVTTFALASGAGTSTTAKTTDDIQALVTSWS